MAEIEGYSPFISGIGFAMLDLAETQEATDGAATSTQLRILRQGPAAERDGGADMHLRMHILRGLRRDQAA
jgi:hypothetical protein